jgi:hypothetical protein
MKEDNPSLVSLDGLGSLASIGQSFYIFRNAALASLDALGSLTSVTEVLWIQDNMALPSCEVDALALRLGKECTGCASGESGAYCECSGNTGSASCMIP